MIAKKRNHRLLFLPAILFLIILVGCKPAITSESPSPEIIVTPAITATLPSITDDFNDLPEGVPPNWETLYAPYREDSKIPDFNKVNVQQGHFLLENLGTNSGLYVLYQGQFPYSDIRLSLDALTEDGGTAVVALVCRYSDMGWYQFSVSNNSSAIQWVALKGKVYDVKVLVDGAGVNLDSGNHTLTAVCDGNALSLLVDGEPHLNIDADYLSTGTFGFGVESIDKLQSRKAFDNLVVQPLSKSVAVAQEKPTLTPSPMPVLSLTATSTPLLLPTPTLRPTPIPKDQLVIYHTDFNDNDTSIQDWTNFAYSMSSDKMISDGYKVFASNGIYRFKPTEMNQRIYSIYQPDLGTSDVSLSLKGAPANDSGNIGLVCRYSEAGWYQFMEESSGQWSIRMAKYDTAGQLHFYILSTGNFWFGGQTELGAECKGDMLSILIDGNVIASLRDGTFPQGKVGLLGWTFTKPDQEGWINQFTVEHAKWSDSSLTGPAATPGADGSVYSTDFKNLNDLDPYWVKTDAGIQTVPGDGMLIGPGSTYSLHAIRLINDFDPGKDIEISADLNSFSQAGRGLICRYSDDGWYQAQYWKIPNVTLVSLVRMERNKSGLPTYEILDSYTLPTATTQLNLSLTCAENQISAAIDGKTVLSVQDNTFSSGKYGLFFMDPPPGDVTRFFKNYLVQVAKVPETLTLDSSNLDGLRSNWSLNVPSDQAIQEKDDITLNALESIHMNTGEQFENSETTIDLDFATDSRLTFYCRQGAPERGEIDVSSSGDWSLLIHGKALASGNSSSIKAEGNQFTFRCWDNEISLGLNGATLASEEFLPGYVAPYVGFNSISFETGSQVKIRDITVTYAPQKKVSTPSVRSNQVVLLPEYQPGENIYSWDINAFVNYRSDPNWSVISLDAVPVEENGQVVINKPAQNDAWEYQPELLDMPVEISAKTVFTGKLGSLGLMCRINSFGHYEFLIQPNGSWLIQRNTNYGVDQSYDKITIIAQGKSDVVKLGENDLDAVCRGNELIFSDNGVELGRVKDDYFPEGKVGILFTSTVSARFSDVTLLRAKND